MSEKRLVTASFRAPLEMKEWLHTQAKALCMSESEYIFIIVSRTWPGNPLKCIRNNKLSNMLAEMQALVYEGIEYADDLPETLRKQIGLGGLRLATTMLDENESQPES